MQSDSGGAAARARHSLAARNFAAAAKQFRAALKAQPDCGALYAGLGQALHYQGRELDALVAWQKSVALEPGAAPVRAMLAQLLFDRGEAEAGAAQLEKILLRDGGSLNEQLALANRLMVEGAHAAALARAGAILAQHPQSAQAQALMGMMQTQHGDFAAARDHYQRALALEPKMARACRALLAMRRVTPDDAPLVAMAAGLAVDGSLPDEERAAAYYALAKAQEDGGDYQSAWTHYKEANRINRRLLVKAHRALDPGAHARTIDQLIDLFTGEFFEAHKDWGSSSQRPVFIIGMIRSGTTLVEQILTAHPAIASGGERKFWSRRGYLNGLLAGPAMDKQGAAQTAAAYETLLNNIAPAAARVTDKMPTNFLLLGLIHLLFPRAKIIHCRRDPRDSCVSIFTTPYGNLPDFAHDWDSITAYYRQYQRLMRHWRRVLPAGTLFEVDYEDLVARREMVTRDLIAFCGVDWDEAALRPQDNKRIVATPSNWQARQRVYDHAIGRWKHYAPWLTRLDELAP